MKDFIKIITRDNLNLIDNYKNDFGEFLKTQNDKESYLTDAYIHLYTQINNTIQALEDKSTETNVILNLLDQLIKLKKIFFEILNKKYFSENWEGVAELMIKYYAEKNYINPSMFNEKYLDLVIKRLFEQNNLVLNKVAKKKPVDSWFKVGIELANGRAFEIFYKYKSLKVKEKRIFITKEIFKDKYEEAFGLYIYGSINGYKSVDKNIFKRSNAEKEIGKIIKYCKQNGHSICDEFLEKCKFYKIAVD